MIVHHVGDGASDDLAHALDDPLAPGVGVAAGKLHGGDVSASEFAALVDYCWRDVHAVLATRGLEVARGAGVAKPAAAEMDADPDKAILVAHQVNIVVARTDGAELAHRLLAIALHVGFAPGVGVVEQFGLYPLVIGAPNAERDDFRHVADDIAQLVLDRGERRIKPNRHVAAAYVKADAGNADLLLIGDDAADRLGIAEVAVGADHAGHDVADRHAIAHLSDSGFVVLAEDFERAILKGRCLRCDRRNLCCRSRGLSRHVFGARRIAERAPCRHRPLAGPFDPGIRIEAGRARQFTGTGLIGVGASHL